MVIRSRADCSACTCSTYGNFKMAGYAAGCIRFTASVWLARVVSRHVYELEHFAALPKNENQLHLHVADANDEYNTYCLTYIMPSRYLVYHHCIVHQQSTYLQY